MTTDGNVSVGRGTDRDADIGPMVRKSPGLRTPGTWDPFETAVRAVCGQMVSVASAGTIVRRMRDAKFTQLQRYPKAAPNCARAIPD